MTQQIVPSAGIGGAYDPRLLPKEADSTTPLKIGIGGLKSPPQILIYVAFGNNIFVLTQG